METDSVPETNTRRRQAETPRLNAMDDSVPFSLVCNDHSPAVSLVALLAVGELRVDDGRRWKDRALFIVLLME